MGLERDRSLIRVCLRDHVGSMGLWSAVGREVVGSYPRNRGEVRRVDVWSGGLRGSRRMGSRGGVSICANPHSLLLPLSRHRSRSLILTKLFYSQAWGSVGKGTLEMSFILHNFQSIFYFINQTW